jgi:methyl-accepting chemotaxis protein
MNIQIAAATEEQSVVASDLHQQLVRMTNITEQNVETAEQLLTTSEQLRQLSQQLAQLSSQFGR